MVCMMMLTSNTLKHINQKTFLKALPYVIHWALGILTVTEKSQWKHQEDVKTQKVNKSVGNIKQAC